MWPSTIIKTEPATPTCNSDEEAGGVNASADHGRLPSGDPLERALLASSLVHGAAKLALTGHLPYQSRAKVLKFAEFVIDESLPVTEVRVSCSPRSSHVIGEIRDRSEAAAWECVIPVEASPGLRDHIAVLDVKLCSREGQFPIFERPRQDNNQKLPVFV